MLKRLLILALPVVLLSSCFEVWDKIYIASNGSGTFQREVNYTETINLMSSLDSTGAAAREMKHTMDSSMNVLKDRISATEGISEVSLLASADSTIFTIRFNFRDIKSLNLAWRNDADGTKPTYYQWKKGKLTIMGGIPGMVPPTPGNEEDQTGAEMMATAKYTVDVQAGIKKKASTNKQYKDWGKRGLRYEGSYGDLMKDPSLNKTVIIYK